MSRLGFGPAKQSDLYLRNARAINKFVHDAYGARIADGTEFFVLISMDWDYRVIQTNVLAEGAPGYVAVSQRKFGEILDAANKLSGRNLYWFALVHNHPSGNPEPSMDDIRMTAALMAYVREAGANLGIVDHVIVTPKRSVYSGMGKYIPEVAAGKI